MKLKICYTDFTFGSPTSISKTTHCSDCENVECCCLKFSNLPVPYGLWMWNCLAVQAIVPHQNRPVAVGRANSGVRNVMGTPQSATPALHSKSPAIMTRLNRNGWTAPRDRRRWASGLCLRSKKMPIAVVGSGQSTSLPTVSQLLKRPLANGSCSPRDHLL